MNTKQFTQSPSSDAEVRQYTTPPTAGGGTDSLRGTAVQLASAATTSLLEWPFADEGEGHIALMHRRNACNQYDRDAQRLDILLYRPLARIHLKGVQDDQLERNPRPGTQSAQTLTDWSINHDNELQVVHPGSGVQAIVTVYDGTGTSVAKAIVAAKTRPPRSGSSLPTHRFRSRWKLRIVRDLSSTGLNVGVYGSSLNPVFASSDASGQFAVLPMKTSIRPRMKGFKSSLPVRGLHE